MQSKKLIKEVRDQSGNIIQSIYQIHDKNRKIEKEYCFSSTGLCLSIRSKNLDGNKWINFLVFDYQFFIVREYQNTYAWSIEWMNGVIKDPKHAMIIADGPRFCS